MAASGIINQRQVDVYADGNWLYPAEDREVMVLHTLTVDPDLSGSTVSVCRTMTSRSWAGYSQFPSA